MFSWLKKYYVTGIKWSDQFIFQRIYIAMWILEIFFLKNILLSVGNLTTYVSYIIFHLASLYFAGYKKECRIGTGDEVAFQSAYFAFNTIIIIKLIFMVKTPKVLLFIIAPTIGALVLGGLITIFISVVFILIDKVMDTCIFIGDNISYSITSMLLNVVLFSVAIFIVSSNITMNIAIIAIYTILIPLINIGEDNGMNFYSFFEIG